VVEAAGDEIIAVRRSGLSEDDKVGLALADNRAAELSDWDAEMLQQLSEEHDIAPWFEQEDLDALLQEAEQLEPVEGNTDPDEVPEAPEDPITKPGDLWILGNHRLLCGDSTNIQHVERLMDGKKADMVFTDPPYGMSYQSNFREKTPQFSVIQNDDKVITDWLPLATAFSSGFCFVWTTWKVLDQWLAATKDFAPLTNMVVWHKPGGGLGDLKGTFLTDHEIALVFNRGAELTGKRIGSVWEITRDSANSYVHPTQKPVALAEQALDTTTKSGHIVLDFFGGSGSTLIACERQHRKARLMELDPAYCDVIVKRWEDFTGNTAICQPSEAHFAAACPPSPDHFTPESQEAF
jgi:DNA modification methylase